MYIYISNDVNSIIDVNDKITTAIMTHYKYKMRKYDYYYYHW